MRNFDPKNYFKNPKDVRRTDRFAQLAMAAAKMAMDDCGIDLEKVNRDRFGVDRQQRHRRTQNTRGPAQRSVHERAVPRFAFHDSDADQQHGERLDLDGVRLAGPELCIVTACATSNNAIGESWRMIKFGDADIFLAGGSEASIVPIGLAGFCAMKALSTRNDEPERASRPFDRDRDGFVMGEGAGVVVVEELEHAKARGAKIYCELAGYGLTADAYHMTAPPPDGEGAARAMQMALEHAGITPERG